MPELPIFKNQNAAEAQVAPAIRFNRSVKERNDPHGHAVMKSTRIMAEAVHSVVEVG
jgi:hypothetical protein